MKKLLVILFAGLTLSACADTSHCHGGATITKDGVICSGPGRG